MDSKKRLARLVLAVANDAQPEATTSRPPMKHKPETILSLLDEVATAKTRAAESQKHPDLTLAEKLDIWRGVDQAAANRFDAVAQAYRELLEAVKNQSGTLEKEKAQ